MSARRFILRNRKPVACEDIVKWGDWMKDDENSLIGGDTIGGARISTIFLGLDHNFFGDGPPLLFDTRVFYDDGRMRQQRCSTYEEARRQHKKACAIEGRKKRAAWPRRAKSLAGKAPR